jgi:hypothetical protein
MPFPRYLTLVAFAWMLSGRATDACLTSTGVAGILLDFRERTTK